MAWQDEEYPHVTSANWHVADSAGLAGSAVAAAYSPLLARALWARNRRTPEECAAWLATGQAPLPPWQAVPDLAAAVERVAAAVTTGQPVAVFGDYDVDGLAATAIVVLTLRAYGVATHAAIPDRARDGYGLSRGAVDRLAAWLTDQQPTGRPLLIVVDCGTSNHAEIAHAAAAGLDVVVLDHHTVPSQLPPAHTLVNPKRPDRDAPFSDLTAAGLACYLARGLLATTPPPIDDRARNELKWTLLSLAALGTAADVAPLVADNRALVSAGLRALRRDNRPGLAALLKITGSDTQTVTSETLVWRLAPRINAAGRMDDPNQALRLLLTDDPTEATVLATHLDRLNAERQSAQERILDEARAILSTAPLRRVPVIAGEGWSPGLVGLVAGRLAEETGRPMVVLSHDGAVARGSARSREGLNITEALASCASLLQRFGGHSQAAGLTIACDQLNALAEALDAAAERAWPDGQPDAVLEIAGAVRLADLRHAHVAALAALEPFGRGNEEPVWLLRDLELLEARPVGRGGAHLQLRLRDGDTVQTAIAFRHGQRHDELVAARRLDVACVARTSVWQGRQRVEVQVSGVRPAGAESVAAVSHA